MRTRLCVYVGVCVRACACACVRVRVCVRARACVCAGKVVPQEAVMEMATNFELPRTRARGGDFDQ